LAGRFLLGISVFTTANAPRAYELATRYRRQGIPVVMGGVHPSALPQEALRFADSVVLGEGEVVWPEVLKDFQQGALKPLYPAPLTDLGVLVGFESLSQESLKEADKSYKAYLTPLPGTWLFERFQAEGRFLYEPWKDSRLWAKFNLFEVVIRPKRMSPGQLAEGLE